MDGRILRGVRANYAEELSSRLLYVGLASRDQDGDRKALLLQLAGFEEEHAALWGSILKRHGEKIPEERLMMKHRVFLSLAKLFGVGSVLSAVHKDEVDGIKKYQAQWKAWDEPDIRKIFDRILPDELSHEIDTFSEARHAVAGGGNLRSAVLGANDGIGSILALSAGVVAATSSTAPVLVAGVSGLVAGAISMAASNYVSVKAEEEMYRGMVTLEKDAVKVDRENKIRQLEAAYRRKGFTREEAKSVVSRLSKNPDEFLRALLLERHGIGEASFSKPLRLGLLTGFAFALAGAVPLVPFFLFPPSSAIVMAVITGAIVLFFTGVMRSFSTLGSLTRSGLEMVLIGLGSAGLTYLIGLGVGNLIR